MNEILYPRAPITYLIGSATTSKATTMSEPGAIAATSTLTSSAAIRQRLKAAGTPFAANDSILGHISAADLDVIQAEVELAFAAVLDALIIDTAQDHNTQGTAERMARMYIYEVFRGRYHPPDPSTEFPNAKKLDELYVVGPITVRSTCSHHFCPIEGQAWIGVIPDSSLLGISKFVRLADWILSRPQIQEEAVVQLADLLENKLHPRGLGVVIRARHACMTWRGVREHATVMTTSVMRGILREAPASRAEFMATIQGDFR